MARAVARAIAHSRHLVVAAGTGTGKSLGYLVPVALSGRKVVVATATKALQDQLLAQDLPLVTAVGDGELSVAVLKGRSNYACWHRLEELRSGLAQGQLGELGGDDDLGPPIAASRLRPVLEHLVAWADASESGDLAELEAEPSPRVWSMVSMGPQDCPGAFRCPEGERCFTERARQRAAAADVVVVNLHLYGAHLASGKTLLPDHDVVVIDEAHEVEAIWSQSLGTEVTPARFRQLGRLAGSVLGREEADLAAAVDSAGARLADALAARLDTRVLGRGGDEALTAVLSGADTVVRRALDAVRALEADHRGDAVARASAVNLATTLSGQLQRLIAISDEDVAWVSGSANRPSLQLAPIDLAPLLAEQLWSTVTGVLTSATISKNLPARLGLRADAVDVLDVGSPFDYRAQSLLYVATHLPDRREAAAEPAIYDELVDLICAAGGRTLALFTSRRVLEAAAAAVAPRVPVEVLVQGVGSKNHLLERFRTEHATCLFATMGFWQGVDVPGEALTLVCIDRLPFGRPDDPLLEARRDRAGDQAFMAVDVPRAATLLAQGAGRLIRTAQDRGVVAVLDPRLATARYRTALLAELPPMRRSIDKSEVLAFLSAIAADQ